jgi:hypothetical protein
VLLHSQKRLRTSSPTQIAYDYCPHTLEDVILIYRGKNTAFEEHELWHMLYALVAAEYDYASLTGNREGKIGDVRPQNIFISSKGKV